jgi:hypothetical protein
MEYNNFSDAYKDAYGFRPCHAVVVEFVNLPDDGARDSYMNNLFKRIERQIAEENAIQAMCAENFEIQVARLMAVFGLSRESVIDKIAQHHDAVGDYAYLELVRNLPDGYLTNKA